MPVGSATALQRRRLENGTSPCSGLWLRRAGLGDRLQREVARRRARSQLAERLARLLLGRTGVREHLDQAQCGLGERSGLVDADRVHRGQGLDRVELLGQHPAAGHAHRRRRIGEADQQHEALGNQADHARRGRGHGGVDGDVTVIQRVAQQQPEADHQDDQGIQQSVHRALQRRARVTERAGLAGHARCVAVGADRLHLKRARALRHERPRAHLLTDRVRDRLGLAGQDRLVQTQVAGRDQPPVGHQLVAGLDQQDVADDHLADGDQAHGAVPSHPRLRRNEQREAVQRALGPHLLGDADRRVGHDHAEEQSVAPIAEDRA